MSNDKKTVKRYTEDFRKLLLNFNSGQSVKSLSSKYGVSEVIYTWINKFNPVELEDCSSVTPDNYAKLQAITEVAAGK